MNRNSLCILVVAALFATTPATAKDPDIATLPRSGDVRVVVAQAIAVDVQPSPDHAQLRLQPGTYPVSSETTVAGERFYLLPIESRDRVRGWAHAWPSASARGERSAAAVLLVREKDGAISPQFALVAQQARDRVLRLQGSLSALSGLPPLEIKRPQTPPDGAGAAAAASQAQPDAAGATARRPVAKVPAKFKIGTKVCRKHDTWIEIGYTAAIDNDTGKIQIRMADALYLNGNPLHPRSFQPGIVWGDPANWDLCDFIGD